MDLTEALDHTFQHAHGVIAGVRPDQYDDATPCSEWTVRELMEHMIGTVDFLGAAAAGTGREPGGAFELETDPAAQFEKVAAANLAAWRAPGALDREVTAGAGTMPGRVFAGINLLDTATHAWDLAKATGQPAELPDDVAEAALAQSRQIVSPQLRPGRFDPEKAAPDDADVTTRLVSFLGRTP